MFCGWFFGMGLGLVEMAQHAMNPMKGKTKSNGLLLVSGKGSQLQKPPKMLGLLISESLESFNLIDHLPKNLFSSKYQPEKRFQHHTNCTLKKNSTQNPNSIRLPKAASPEVEKTLTEAWQKSKAIGKRFQINVVPSMRL